MTISLTVSHLTLHDTRRIEIEDGPITAGYLHAPETTRILRDAFPMMTDNVQIRAVPPECTMSQLSEKGGDLLVQEVRGTEEEEIEMVTYALLVQTCHETIQLTSCRLD
jgi:hypothetical protein